jgi:7-carboxy-7-deazaguanine synthase
MVMPFQRTDKIPVIEHYGPVLQGEGLLIGRPTYFVRLGGCDYLCKQCDSMHAVDPKQIEKEKTVMSARELGRIVAAQCETYDVSLVTLSGGNPALWGMLPFIEVLGDANIGVAIETQGSVWKDWIAACVFVTISPKGPGMIDDVDEGLLKMVAFLEQLREARGEKSLVGTSIKIPIFDRGDLEFASRVKELLYGFWFWTPAEGAPMYLSVGNKYAPGAPEGWRFLDDGGITSLRNTLVMRYEEIERMIYKDFPELMDCALLPQMHVLQHGNKRQA